MRPNRGGRRLGRLAALAAAIGALWLLGVRTSPEILAGQLGRLLAEAGLSQALLADRLPTQEAPEGLEAMALELLPQAAEPDTDPEPEAEVETTPDTESLSEPEVQPDEPELPTAGLLEAPETEQWPEEAPEETWADFSHAVSPDDLELTNSTDGLEPELADYLSRDLSLTLSQEGPQILIMHTHGTEAYTMADGDDYTPSDTARTTDENYNMIRVGEEMKAVFESMGLSVVHDTSLYDYPSYTGSYARSLKGIQSYLEEYPTISVVLDVHRDALIGADGTAYKVTDTLENGETIAQVMLVVGSNDGGLEHPNWEANFTLAAHIQAAMLALDPGFPRPVNLRSQRFNQHMTAGSLLVEVGTSGNTLQEALAGARQFARAAGKIYLDCMEE